MTPRAALRESRCPRCERQELVAGPWGGCSRNLYCPHCFIGWNIHAPHWGIIGVDCIGPVTQEKIDWARGVYPDQPWRLGPVYVC